MPATALPPSGESPLTDLKTCDARGMLEVHRAFRKGFDEAIGLIDGVSSGDTAHADVVAQQLMLMSTTLHAHHESEDEHLWDMLDQRAPSCAAHVGRMKAQHAQMVVHLEALNRALPAWRASASATDAAPLRAALQGVSESLATHLPDEEANIVPVIEQVVTKKEIDWFAEHGRNSTPKGQGWYMLGAIISAQPGGGRDWVKQNLPAPGRLAWRLVGAPRYAKYRAALEGRSS
ncbi:hemerythrin domain-containing protein [Gryllotalpicola protaetiae]|uniref:Hemerythrin domain-containing protein n=2 Tax=Gryllotalpicola protaetiae TaxID=2419771 RepID=A0A387BWG5_9MICO|nr:hemerythrin domain-containing protein [Gryllotalpicola protaetiae]